ncbi:MAG: DUF3866 family protein [Actinomycetota bacterium]
MAVFRTGTIAEIIEERSDLVTVAVTVGEEIVEAVGFPSMLPGALEVGHRVVVNTTGLDLDLGTGGQGFILWNLDGDDGVEAGPGHIVKMRYTPWQLNVLAAEAPESEHRGPLETARELDGTPVVVCGLHSQVAAAVAGIKGARPDVRVGYLMTDGGALPLAWSRSIRRLRDEDLIDVTATCGHSFGGDLECINVYTGLLALRYAGGAEVIVVAMGPGVVGTGTALGFSAMEQGQVLDAVTAVAGRSIAALRISFADERVRHLGVSHHTLTALTVAAREATTVVVPALPPERGSAVEEQLREAGITDRHQVVVHDGGPGLRLLGSKGLRPSTMGRSIDADPELFVAASAAGAFAASLL